MEQIIKQYTDKIVNELNGNLEALILVGSFARGEEIIYKNNGKTELISDIEFWALLKKNRKKDLGVSKGADIDKDKVTLGFTTKKHLPRLKPYIFTVEAKKFGKVVWGDSNILELIPDYSYENIAPLDGFILLNNRIVEQLIVWHMISNGLPVRCYDIVKGYIQLANSYLTINGKYRSLYQEKKDEFNNNYNKDQNLKRKVNEAFGFLEHPDNRMLAEDDKVNQWRELRSHFREMWLEETKLFLTSPIFETFNGWLKVILASKKRTLFSFSEIISNLFRTSPQFIIYQSAVREYFADNPDVANVARVIKQWEKVVK